MVGSSLFVRRPELDLNGTYTDCVYKLCTDAPRVTEVAQIRPHPSYRIGRIKRARLKCLREAKSILSLPPVKLVSHRSGLLVLLDGHHRLMLAIEREWTYLRSSEYRLIQGRPRYLEGASSEGT